MAKRRLVMDHGAYAGTRQKFDLHEAVKCNSITEVEALLQNGADVNAINEQGMTPFHISIKRNSIEMVQLLLKSGANVMATDSFGETALHYAVEENSIQLVELLVQNGADVNATNQRGMTPLRETAFGNCIEIAELLLNCGTDVNIRDNVRGNTVLHDAVVTNSVEMVELILQHEVDVNATNCLGDTALHISAEYDFIEIAKALLSYGANARAKNFSTVTPLDRSVRNGNHVEMVKLLLQHGADTNDSYIGGDSPLSYCVLRDYVELTELLLKWGANANVKSRCSGSTILHGAICQNSLQCTKLLLKHGADINAKYKKGRTAIQFALWWETFDIVREIIRQHVLRNEAPHLCINDEDLEQIEATDELSGFKSRCEQELELLKRQKLSESTVSYYNFLANDRKQLVAYMANEKIVHEFGYWAYQFWCPIYSDMIDMNFRQAHARQNLVKSSLPYFHYLLRCIGCSNAIVFLETFIKDVFDRLNDEDLHNLINSCSDVVV